MSLPSLACLLMRGSILFTLAAAHAAPLDSGSLLERIRSRVIETTARLPNYLCTETIDRIQYEPVHRPDTASCEALTQSAGWTRRRSTSDRLRLDVAVGSNTEMYSWVGENRFDERDLAELVGSGPVSTGSFASFLMAVFRDQAATFSYKGEKTLEARRVHEFAFEVPLEKSRYHVLTPGHDWGVAA